ncbi:MAG: hypothetical protein JW728_06870 [Candidatus Aureabacteria bacterium]|nr:hypothetical protein [Candidatus Auribacterota bacterium]
MENTTSLKHNLKLEKALTFSLIGSYAGTAINVYAIYFIFLHLNQYSISGFLTATLLSILVTIYSIAFALYCGLFKLLIRLLDRIKDSWLITAIMPLITFCYSSAFVYLLWIIFRQQGTGK